MWSETTATTTSTIWTGWSSSTNQTCTSTSCTAWDAWNTSSTSVTSTGDTVFVQWVTDGTGSSTSNRITVHQSVPAYGNWVARQEETREQKAARAQQQLKWKAEQKERDAAKQQARFRAKKILAEHLTGVQKQTLEKEGYFDVQVVGRNFRIYNDRYQHNVFELDDQGKKIREFCAHTSHACPQEDHSLAQKLMLEHALENFQEIANVWDLKGQRRLVSQSRQQLVLS